MRRNWHKCTSEHKFDSTIRLSNPENLMVTKLSLYDKGCGRKSHIFTAHAQKREQYYFRSQFEQHHSTQRPRKPNSHEIIALRQRIRWGACSQHYMGRKHCVQLLVYFYVTLYNRFWTLATLREYYFYLFIFLFELIGYFSSKSLRGVAWYPCKLKKAVKLVSKCLKSSSKFRHNLPNFAFFVRLLTGRLASYVSIYWNPFDGHLERCCLYLASGEYNYITYWRL